MELMCFSICFPYHLKHINGQGVENKEFSYIVYLIHCLSSFRRNRGQDLSIKQVRNKYDSHYNFSQKTFTTGHRHPTTDATLTSSVQFVSNGSLQLSLRPPPLHFVGGLSILGLKVLGRHSRTFTHRLSVHRILQASE